MYSSRRALGALVCAVAALSGCAVFDDDASSDDDSDIAGAIASGLGVFAQALADTNASSGRRSSPAYVPPSAYVPPPAPAPRPRAQQAQQLAQAPLQPLPPGRQPAQSTGTTTQPPRVEQKFVAKPPDLSNLPPSVIAPQSGPRPAPAPVAQGNVAAPAKLWMPPAPGMQERTPSSRLDTPPSSPNRTTPAGGGGGSGRDRASESQGSGTASTRDDPHRCITAAIDTKSVFGNSCRAFEVYNRCSAPVDIRTCVYLTQAGKWSCELQSVRPNQRKVHDTCSPTRSRFVDVKYSDDYRTRLGNPPAP